MARCAFEDSVDQDQTAENVHADLESPLSHKFRFLFLQKAQKFDG